MSSVIRYRCQSAITGSSSRLGAYTLLTSVHRPRYAQNTSFGKVSTSFLQIKMSSGAHQGRIPWEELPEKDGKKYYPFGGPLGEIRETIQRLKHKKWGLLIYRCDYVSDETWTKFVSNVRHEMDECFRILRADDLQETFELTTKADRQRLDGASVDQVRDIFKEWVQSDEAKAENNNQAHPTFQFPRYTFCVHVDAGVLDSVVNRAPQPPAFDARQIAYVNLVQLRHESSDEGGAQLYGDADEFDGNGGDENFVKVPLGYIGPESYNSLYDLSTFERYARYRRDDDVSCGG